MRKESGRFCAFLCLCVSLSMWVSSHATTIWVYGQYGDKIQDDGID
jgi:hypothetical protein